MPDRGILFLAELCECIELTSTCRLSTLQCGSDVVACQLHSGKAKVRRLGHTKKSRPFHDHHKRRFRQHRNDDVQAKRKSAADSEEPAFSHETPVRDDTSSSFKTYFASMRLQADAHAWAFPSACIYLNKPFPEWLEAQSAPRDVFYIC